MDRTWDQRIISPGEGDVSTDAATGDDHEASRVTHRGHLEAADAELRVVLAAWARLTPSVRAAIVALVAAARRD